MRHLILILCMTITTVLMTATATIALPACPSDPTKRHHNCLGTWIAPTGDIYVGEIKDGIFNGQGTLTLASGDRYVGAFKDGDLNGYAIQYRADGSILREGIFKNGEFLYAQN